MISPIVIPIPNPKNPIMVVNTPISTLLSDLHYNLQFYKNQKIFSTKNYISNSHGLIMPLIRIMNDTLLNQKRKKPKCPFEN